MRRDLRHWLTEEAPKVGLLHVDEEVDPEAFEAAAILEQLEAQGAPPPVLFRNVRSLAGPRSEFALAFNAFSSLEAVAAALDVTSESWPALMDAYVERVGKTRPVERVDEAACHENVRTGDDIDVRVLPWSRHVTMDGGPYFTPIIVSRPHDAERYNLSWNRTMYLDPKHIAVHLSPRHLWAYQRAAEESGEDLPIALVLGHHPAFNLAAAALTTESDDEMEIAGALLGHPVAVAPSVSYGDRLMIPADAEVVVEGRLLAGRRAVEGPFGEYLSYVGPQKMSHVLEVDALTWRTGATVLEIFTSHLDHLNAHISIEASLLQKTRAAIPQVVGISWFRGGGPTTLIIAVRKTSEGQPMRAAMAAMAASNIIKQVIIVDDDIDIENTHEVMWAVSTRLRADEDVTVLHNLQGNLLDPSQIGHGKTSGLVLDATKPLGEAYPPNARVPEAAVAKYPLSQYQLRKAPC